MDSKNNTGRQRCEIWTRVMGYHRPKSGFNIGKKQEYNDRDFFKEPDVIKKANKGFVNQYAT